MRPDHLRLLGALGLGACLALGMVACPNDLARLCPEGTAPGGSFAVTLTPQPSAGGDCGLFSTDGGVTVTGSGVRGADGGVSTSAALCAVQAADGGPVLITLARPGDLRTAKLDSDGGVVFQNSVGIPSAGTACGCPVTEQEDLAARLTGNGPHDSLVTQLAEGGISLNVKSFTGTLQARVIASDPSATCACTLPCTLTYSVQGVRQ